jgi:NAD(P)-dependent dehydrogenase (short-subunit alcohol dehydrogenase family)
MSSNAILPGEPSRQSDNPAAGSAGSSTRDSAGGSQLLATIANPRSRFHHDRVRLDEKTVKIDRAVDALLEAAVVPSFTRIGFAVRSRLESWPPAPDTRLDGRVVVVTGATSGLGKAAAAALARAGATVEVIGRDADKLDATRLELTALAPQSGIETVTADLSDLAAVRRAAEEIGERHSSIHAVIHNAGALSSTYEVTREGIEKTFAAHVIGPFLLSALLCEPLRVARPGRIIWVASGGMYTEPLSTARLEVGANGYRGTTVYARAKRAQVTLSEMMAARVDPQEIVVHAMHPGWALTPGVESSLPRFRMVTGPLLRDAAQGADTMIWLATDDGMPVASTGRFWLDRRPRSIHRLRSTRAADTAQEREALWSYVVQHAGVDFRPGQGPVG